jgi:nucleotide-binding universal stress UspA family protein
MAVNCPTGRVEKILLSTDGSEYSEGAIREAIKLAKKCSSTLSVLSVIETNPELETIAPQVTEKAEKKARLHLDDIQARAKKDGIVCDCIIREGEDSYTYIVDEAVKRKSTMIVMGRRGRTGLRRLMMGSVTARVIGHAPCTVLVVPRAAEFECRHILVATDGSTYGDAAAAEAISMAKQLGSRLTALSVVHSESMSPMDIVSSQMQRDLIAEKEMKEAEQNVKKVKDAAVAAGIKTDALIMGGKPSEAIIQTAKDKQADLIVLGSHGKTGVEKLLVGSVAERVIVLSPCPVLVVKKNKEA